MVRADIPRARHSGPASTGFRRCATACSHIDHVGGAAELRDALKVPIEGPHVADKYLLDNVVESGARFGMTGGRNFEPDRWLDEGDRSRSAN